MGELSQLMLLLNARLATQLDTNMNNTWSLVDKIKRGLLG